MDNSALWFGVAAAVAAATSAIAWFGDRAQTRRHQLENVGIMPWRAVSFWSTVLALVLIAAAIRAWQQG